MTPFLFRCRHTRQYVQSWVADEGEDGVDTYQFLKCLACQRVHFVNPKTGNVLGAVEERSAR
jgi:hypothetical protein